MLNRKVRPHENIEFDGKIMNGSIGENATVNCNDRVLINGAILPHAKIICAGSLTINGQVYAPAKITCQGTPTFHAEVEDGVVINCKGMPVFNGPVGDNVIVNGVLYKSYHHEAKRHSVSSVTLGGIGSEMIVNGCRVKVEAPKPGRIPVMVGVALGDKFYKRIDQVPDENAIEVTDLNGVATKYRGNFVTTQGGELIIDGRPIRKNDDRIISDKPNNKRVYENTHEFVQDILQHVRASCTVETKLTPEERFLSECTPETIAYIKSFEGNKSHTEIVNEMSPPLTKTELDQLAGCTAKFTGKVMDRPVILKLSSKIKNVFDFCEILKMIDQGATIDANSIEPCLTAVTAFDNGIKKIIESRNQQSIIASVENDVKKQLVLCS